MKFGTTVNFTGEALASSDKDATSLSDVIRFLASMAQSSTEAQPIAALLQTLNVTTSGSTLKISLSVPEDQLEAVLNSAKAGHVHAEHVHGGKI